MPFNPQVHPRAEQPFQVRDDEEYEPIITEFFDNEEEMAKLQKWREECEEKLAELIKTMKAEIAEMKKAAKKA